MIISHEHRFIFLKTRKTAGTSIEAFLAHHAGPDAIVTPILPPVAGHVAQGERRPFNPMPEILRTRSIKPALSDLRRRRTFYNHIDATRIRERLGKRRWESYFKFCFERDPWAKSVSYFHWTSWTDPTRDFESFVLRGDLPTDFDRYSIGAEMAMDFVGRFEQLTTDLESVFRQVGIGDAVELGREKQRSARPGPQPDVRFTPEMDARVSTVFAREIDRFGYEDRSARPTLP